MNSIKENQAYIEYYRQAQATVMTAMAGGDFIPAFELVAELKDVAHSSGVVSALTLYEIWEAMQLSSPKPPQDLYQDFVDLAQAHAGINKSTLQRYVLVGRMHKSGEIPGDLEFEIMALPLATQIRLAQRWSSGTGDFGDEEYLAKVRKILEAGGSSQAVTEYLGKAKEPKKNRWGMKGNVITYDGEAIAKLVDVELSQDAKDAIEKLTGATL